MTQGNRPDPFEEAADWHARLGAPDMDWEAFGAWLDARPANRAAYDRIATLDADIMAAAPAIAARLPANDEPETIALRHRPVLWLAGAGAAAIVAVALALPSMIAHPAVSRDIATRAHETRSLTLADGSSIRIDRASRLRVTEGASPVVEIAKGTANFSVRHDPARSFTVRASGYEVRDVGTRFDVSASGDSVVVTVAEGAVNVARSGQDDGIAVTAGQRLDLAAGAARRSRVDPATVGSWSSGRLVYDNAPLALVAGDISRYAGARLTVDPSAAGMRFSGVLTIGDGSHLVDQVQKLLPVRARRAGGLVHLERAG